MKRFALFICTGSVIILIISLFLIYHNWSHGLSIWGPVLESIAMLIIGYSSYISYKKYK